MFVTIWIMNYESWMLWISWLRIMNIHIVTKRKLRPRSHPLNRGWRSGEPSLSHWGRWRAAPRTQNPFSQDMIHRFMIHMIITIQIHDSWFWPYKIMNHNAFMIHMIYGLFMTHDFCGCFFVMTPARDSFMIHDSRLDSRLTCNLLKVKATDISNGGLWEMGLYIHEWLRYVT